MTSTNECIIGVGKRNSSRVLRPPGGGSSFSLFGGPPDEPKTSKVVQPEITHSTPAAATTASNTDVNSKNEQQSEQSDISDTPALALVSEESEVVAVDNTVSEENGTPSGSDGTADEVKESQVDEKLEEDVKVTLPSVVEKTQVPEPQIDKSGKSKNQTQQYNPITGESYVNTADSDARKAATNIRVRQPPGGASTKLW